MFEMTLNYPKTLTLQYARVAELVDALASGASVGNNVEVQVLSRAPFWEKSGSYLKGQ